MRFEFSAGGIVFKEGEELQVLLIQPVDQTRPNGWSLPKGKFEQGEKAPEAALREVKEETGIEAEIISKVDDIGYFFKATWSDGAMVKKKVSYFLMKYLSGEPTLQEGETRAVQWFPIGKSLENMAYKGDRTLLEKAIKMIEENLKR